MAGTWPGTTIVGVLALSNAAFLLALALYLLSARLLLAVLRQLAWYLPSTQRAWKRSTLVRPAHKLEQHMRAVAEGRVARVLAAAKQRKLGPLRRENEGLDPGVRMGAVAKGLLLAPPAAAPGVALAGFEHDLIGTELRSFGLCHGASRFPPLEVPKEACLANSLRLHKKAGPEMKGRWWRPGNALAILAARDD